MSVKLFLSAILKFILGVLLVGVLVFLPAGRTPESTVTSLMQISSKASIAILPWCSKVPDQILFCSIRIYDTFYHIMMSLETSFQENLNYL